jgi:hypothetical protein
MRDVGRDICTARLARLASDFRIPSSSLSSLSISRVTSLTVSLDIRDEYCVVLVTTSKVRETFHIQLISDASCLDWSRGLNIFTPCQLSCGDFRMILKSWDEVVAGVVPCIYSRASTRHYW